jgi:hypothetical protein
VGSKIHTQDQAGTLGAVTGTGREHLETFRGSGWKVGTRVTNLIISGNVVERLGEFITAAVAILPLL